MQPPSRSLGLQGTSILVTGHTGFKGSWLALWLASRGARVSGYALDPPTTPSNYGESSIAELLSEDIRGDVTDAAELRHVVGDLAPDVVFHLAAQPIVREAIREPAATFATNLMGTVNLLEAIRTTGRRCVVIVVTSDKCYQIPGGPVPLAESDPLGGNEPYAASKAAAEMAVSAYRSTYFPPDELSRHGVALASARAGNVLGGGDWAPGRLVPDVLADLAAGRAVEVRFPGAVRPWQHVLEPLSGYIDLAGNLLAGPDPARYCSAWNFGPAQEDQVDVRTVVEEVIRYWGSGGWQQIGDGRAPHEEPSLRLDSTRARQMLGWFPRWDFSSCIDRTVTWYRQWLDNAPLGAARSGSMRAACLADIDEYESIGARRG